jgi:adenine deaminase
MIREGSAAKNFETLIPLLDHFPEQIMFCCDDKHPDNLIEGHINQHVKRALEKGHDLFNTLRAASYNVIKHYQLPVGLLQLSDTADFIEINSIDDFTILRTYIHGKLVAENGKSLLPVLDAPLVNNFNCNIKQPSDFKIKTESETIRVIEVLEGQLITNEIFMDTHIIDGYAESNIINDVLKIAVVNRYNDSPVAVAFIKNVGLTSGAIASCVAHDCHNIVVVGTNDNDMCAAVNLIIKAKGGISLSIGNETMVLELPIAGIMTNQQAEKVAEAYTKLDRRAKEMGSKLRAPYMSLSFMALLVIPHLKLSDQGLFNGKSFEFTNVFVN